MRNARKQERPTYAGGFGEARTCSLNLFSCLPLRRAQGGSTTLITLRQPRGLSKRLRRCRGGPPRAAAKAVNAPRFCSFPGVSAGLRRTTRLCFEIGGRSFGKARAPRRLRQALRDCRRLGNAIFAETRLPFGPAAIISDPSLPRTRG